MDKICCLKFHLSWVDVIFINEFALLIKTPPFYEVNSFNRKWLVHGGISKIFYLDHFSRPEMLNFHPYSILTG